MIQLFIRSAFETFRPPLRRYVWLSLALAAVAIAALVGLSWAALVRTRLIETAWLDWLADLLGVFAVLALAAILFPAMLGLVSSFFLDAAAGALERARYPGGPAPRAVPLGQSLWLAVRFALLLVAVNLAALPLYLVVMWLPPLNLALFAAVNGYLVGREYYEMVAMRHEPEDRVRAGFRANRGRLFAAGTLVALSAAVPVVNLLSPLIATAFMVHLYRRLRA